MRVAAPSPTPANLLSARRYGLKNQQDVVSHFKNAGFYVTRKEGKDDGAKINEQR